MNLNNLSELEEIGLSFVIITIIFRMIFFNESWSVLLKTVLTIYWIFVLPGIGLTYALNNIGFIERFAVSVCVSAAEVGILAYYLGLAGVHVKYSAVILPAALMVISGAIMFRKLRVGDVRVSEKIGNNAP